MILKELYFKNMIILGTQSVRGMKPDIEPINDLKSELSPVDDFRFDDIKFDGITVAKLDAQEVTRILLEGFRPGLVIS